MAENISPFSISAPGFYGINLSESPVDLSPNFALIADNCVIDSYGRVAARKGYSPIHGVNSNLTSTGEITCIGELVQNDGTITILASGNGYLFKYASGALTTLTYGGGGSAPTISENNWQFCQLNGIAMFWQRGYDPLIYDPAVSTTTFRRLSEKSGSVGTVYTCNTAIAAYGRVWAADTASDKNTVVWSDLLTPHIWTGGTSGSIDLKKVWPIGGDQVVTMAAHNGLLFIFGRRQILVYEGADDPSTMKLKDSIVGIGCIARDSVQETGEDIIFLANDGVRSIYRTIQEQSSPIGVISKNVNDYVNAYVTLSDTDDIKSGYSKVNQFYLLTMPSSLQTLCFDTKQLLQNGAARSTTWSQIQPTAFAEINSRKLYLGGSGGISEYTGYDDNGSSYRLKYYSTWIDFQPPLLRTILKKIKLTLIGGVNQTVVFKWAFDFNTTYFSETTQLTGQTVPAEYNVGEYSVAEYSGTSTVGQLGVNASSSGQVIQVGFEMDVINYPISMQKIDIFTKEGRL